MKKLYLLSGMLALAMPVLAEHNAFIDEQIKHWKTSKQFTVAVAEAMPESAYDFKPNKDEMSFGELMSHIGVANAFLVGRTLSVKPPFGKPEKNDKATAIKLLNDTFDWVIKQLDALTPEQLEGKAGTGSVREGIWSAFTHTAHHRGQAEVYLRMKEIKPPAYTF